MDKLFSIEELDRWATAPAPKELHYFAREDFQTICKFAADIMRENERLREACEWLIDLEHTGKEAMQKAREALASSKYGRENE